MFNFLGYDIHDLELTTVKDNAHLKSLLINSSWKGIFVVEDIDCLLDITQKRKNKEDDSDSDSDNKHKKRIIVFTTNHVDKLDPILIRRGRMDMHIELSYCALGGFKVLAKNYLNLDSHLLFEKIGNLLEEVNMTPSGKDPTACLESLIEALAAAKEKKIEEEDAKTLEIAEEEEIEEEIAKKEEIEEKDAKTLETVEEKEIEEKTVEEEETEEEDAKILETAEEKNKKEE
ncbi:hypothetical protein QQP08_017432 [Theobroma cacao]|nr:hypothetical protein QQP08_017432 [Theobroma cacao]